jgi:hypothetical protein
VSAEVRDKRGRPVGYAPWATTHESLDPTSGYESAHDGTGRCRKCGGGRRTGDNGWCSACLGREEERRAHLTLYDSRYIAAAEIGFRSSLPMIEWHADSGLPQALHSKQLSGVSRDKLAGASISREDRDSEGDSLPGISRDAQAGPSCGWCEKPIPAFKAGRKVRADVRFCSPRCRKTAQRHRDRRRGVDPAVVNVAIGWPAADERAELMRLLEEES